MTATIDFDKQFANLSDEEIVMAFHLAMNNYPPPAGVTDWDYSMPTDTKRDLWWSEFIKFLTFRDELLGLQIWAIAATSLQTTILNYETQRPGRGVT